MRQHPTQKRRVLPIMLLLLCGVFLFSLPSVSAVLNDSILSYSFESLPGITVTDDSGNGSDLILTDGGIASTFAKIGDWGLFPDTVNYGIGETDINLNFEASPVYLKDGRTYSFWIYPPSTSDRNEIFVDMANKTNAANPLVWLNYDTDTRDLYLRVYDQHNGGWKFYETVDPALTANAWNHVVIFLNTSGGAWNNINGYVNNDYYNTGGNWSNTANNGAFSRPSYANSQSNNTLIGLNNQSTNPAGTLQPFFIDQFMIYNRSLTHAEVSQLYNSGYGFDPYSTDKPTQIASLAAVIIPTMSQTDIDYGDFFIGETNISVNFSYGAASYGAYFDQNAATADFNVVFQDIDTVRYYSYGDPISAVPITVSACNANGCVNVTTSLRISGYSVVTQIASIDDWSIVSGNTETREFSDYFGGPYNSTFLQYTDPDGASTINVSAGFPDTNSCFSATIVGDTLQVTGINTAGCTVSARLIADDGSVAVTSVPDFNIIITPIAAIQGGAVASYFDSWLTLFPDADDISNTMKSLIVFIFMIAVVVMGGIMANRGGDARLITIGAITLGLFGVIFFTAIGYIPLWVIALLVGIVIMFIVSRSARMWRGGV